GEQAADLLLALAVPLRQEVGALHRDEVGFGFLGYGLGQQGLAGAWWAIEQEALGWPDPQPLERPGRLERQFHALAQLFLGIVQAADIGPADRRGLDHHFA